MIQFTTPTATPYQAQTSTRQAAYWHGFQAHCDEIFAGRPADVAALSDDECRGYNAACRTEADAATSAYLAGGVR